MGEQSEDLRLRSVDARRSGRPVGFDQLSAPDDRSAVVGVVDPNDEQVRSTCSPRAFVWRMTNAPSSRRRSWRTTSQALKMALDPRTISRSSLSSPLPFLEWCSRTMTHPVWLAIDLSRFRLVANRLSFSSMPPDPAASESMPMNACVSASGRKGIVEGVVRKRLLWHRYEAERPSIGTAQPRPFASLCSRRRSSYSPDLGSRRGARYPSWSGSAAATALPSTRTARRRPRSTSSSSRRTRRSSRASHGRRPVRSSNQADRAVPRSRRPS